ncbi:aromatic ring-hydroxylating oxygenase subunit alpha [Minwuia sp.]|uniref:aromatic ring-hydroxylating oxygenase subunit alpha n=1 Tax=Minwuia sp. TaxID=2493630 RepID=UPI003A9084B5
MKQPRDLQERLFREAIKRIETRSPPLAQSSAQVSAERYVSPDFLDRELATIFRQNPVYCGLTGEVPEPGDYLTRELPGLSLLIVRGQDQTVRAFRNRCRHRGTRVAEGAGNARHFVCPYHAWTYGTDGVLSAVAEADAFPDVEVGRDGLCPVPLIEWGGLLFVQPTDVSAAQARDMLRPIMEELEGFAFADYRVRRTFECEKPTNWKMGVDTFLEAYHVPVLHSATIGRTLIGGFALYEPLRPHARLVAPRRPIMKLTDAQIAADPLHRHAIIVYRLFPNTVFVSMETHVEIHRFDPVPGKPNRMRWSLVVAASPLGQSQEPDWDQILDLAAGVVEREDLVMMAQIQKNLDDEGPDAPVIFGRNEPALQDFHAEIDIAMGAQKPLRRPEAPLAEAAE